MEKSVFYMNTPEQCVSLKVFIVSGKLVIVNIANFCKRGHLDFPQYFTHVLMHVKCLES